MISKNTIDLVKQVSVVDIISSFIKLKKKGSDEVACCPFHNEKTPSFTVSSSKGIYKCFGCGRSGDGISFVMEYERKSYPEAIEIIASKNNINVEIEGIKHYEKPLPRLEKLLPETIKYFEGRGISNNTTLRMKISESKEWMPIADKVIPVICFNYFRSGELVNIKYRGKNKDFKLNKQSELVFYNLDSLIDEPEGIIVEGEIDALSCIEAGIYPVISVPNGANVQGNINLAYLDNSWDQIKHVTTWHIFTDKDEPGQRLRDELSLRLGKSKCNFITPPADCKDANDVLLNHGPEALRHLIVNSTPCILPPDKNSSFPFEIFSPEIARSFKEVAAEYSIPPDYFGITALFTVSALSGSMYNTAVSIQNIIYGMLIGPSGLGKSPAYNILCGDIVEPLEQELFDKWKKEFKEWEDRAKDAKHAKPPQAFKEPKPSRRVRTAKGGTVEGIQTHAMTSPAGFGLYYDEGGKMLGSPNQFKKETSSVDFWNEIWNGKYFNELRSDSERERFASKTRVSVLIGMQTERVKNYFTKDATESGLTYRFLFTQSDYIELNEYVDHFSQRRQPCGEWKSLISSLFCKGAYDYFKDDEPVLVGFTDTAALMYNQISGNLVESSNSLRKSRKIGDADEMLIGYESKLYSYFGRFMLVLAIMDNYKQPIISEDNVNGALKLYNYFRDQAKILFLKLNADNASDLSENERAMYESLPSDREFTTDDIKQVAKDLKMSEKFFDTAYRRKYKMGWVRKISKGKYVKD